MPLVHFCIIGSALISGHYFMTGALKPAIVGAIIAVAAAAIFWVLPERSIPQTLLDGYSRMPKSTGTGPERFLHALQWTWDPASFLETMRVNFPQGIFSLEMSDGPHVFMYNPELSAGLLNLPVGKVSAGAPRRALLMGAFDCKGMDVEKLHISREMFSKPLILLSSDSKLDQLMKVNIAEINRTMADLVTFNTAPADQMDWEVVAGAEVVQDKSGTRYVEVDWMKLVSNYMGRITTTALFGTDFVYNFPDIWGHLETFDKGFKDLTTEKPWWMRQPMRQPALKARKKMLEYMREFSEALGKHVRGRDAGVKWQDLENVNEVVKLRYDVFTKQNMDLDSMASSNLWLFWALHTNTNPLTAWMIFEISRDAVILEQIREEIAPYVRIVEEDNNFGAAVWLPPRIDKLDMRGLLKKCVLLKAAYIETLRLYTDHTASRDILHDIMIEAHSQSHRPYVIGKDSVAHVTQGVHQMDPRCFEEPNEWRPQRHIQYLLAKDGKTWRSADFGTLKPFSKCMLHGVETD